jgi:hypothetical protein
VQQLPYVDEALMERFGVDFRMVQLPAATAPNLTIFERDYYAHRPLGFETAYA